jgi:hypothetical protein
MPSLTVRVKSVQSSRQRAEKLQQRKYSGLGGNLLGLRFVFFSLVRFDGSVRRFDEPRTYVESLMRTYVPTRT